MNANRKLYSKIRRLALVVCFALASCGGGGSGDSSSTDNSGGASTGVTLSAVRESFVNKVVLELFTDLNNKAGSVLTTVEALKASVTEGNFVAAREAWIQSRVPWEQSEASLFGPADIFGIDPAIDSWPLSESDLKAVLDSGETFSEGFIQGLDSSLKGFHALEYILFGQANSRVYTTLTSRELDFAVALAKDLKRNTQDLLNGWTIGFAGQEAYATIFQNAGQPGNTVYPTEQLAVEQIVRGMLAICGEVSDGKIQDPFIERNPDLVESQYSYNTHDDFANNIRGVKYVLENSLRSFIQERNAGLYSKLIAQSDGAVASILAIPRPFGLAIQDGNNDAAVTKAQNDIRALSSSLEAELLPLVNQ